MDIRVSFIRKVYGILLAQFLFTIFIVLIIMQVDALQDYFRENIWILIVCIVVFIGSLIALFCFKNLARSVPANYIILGICTFAEALLVGVVCSFYDPVTILIAVAMTLQVTIVLTVYAATTKTDFSGWHAFMFMITISALMFLLLMVIFYSSRWAQVLVSSVFSVIYGIYIIIDTQAIIANHKYSIGYDDYVLGAASLYIDIVGLFVQLLSLFNNN